MAKASEIRFEDSPLRGSSWFQLWLQPRPVAASSQPDAPLREDLAARAGWRFVQLEPQSPSRQPPTTRSNSSVEGIGNRQHTSGGRRRVATEGPFVCLFLVRATPGHPTWMTATERRENPMTSSNLRPEYVSLQDAATLYAVSVDLLRHRIATGELPAVHAGRRLIRVRLDDLKRMFRPLPAARKYRKIA